MGNQPSKKSSDSKPPSATPSTTSLTTSGNGPPLESLPSFSKHDTVGSARSIRGSLRSKIGTSKDDKSSSNGGSVGPAAAPSMAPIDKSDAISVKSTASQRSSRSARVSSGSLPAISPGTLNSNTPSTPTTASRMPATRSMIDDAEMAPAASSPTPEPPEMPPSPTMSSTLGKGHHALEPQHSAEVENISSEAPGHRHDSVSAQAMEPKESILIRRPGQEIPITKPTQAETEDQKTPNSPFALSAPKGIDLDEMISRLLDAGYAGKPTKSVCLKNIEITSICHAVKEVFLSQPPLLELSPPVKIVGDVHGQYTDLIRMFEMCGFPPSSNYLFLGDYVDRGKQSLETILLLFCYKLKYPDNFFLLRGNHESANVTRVYGFYDECKRRCNIKIWKTFIDTFNTLPIASIVAGKIFCVHGGLSPSLHDMDDIRNIARPTDVPDYGLLNDLLWSDPADMNNDWEENERGVSYCFGKKVIVDFLARHDFDLVCRAHMVVEDGYEFFNERTLVTVFSAPNYCGEFDNWGAVMSVSGELLCSFELLKPLDSSALKMQMKKSAKTRRSIGGNHQSPPAPTTVHSWAGY